jgi:hypothetical protein
VDGHHADIAALKPSGRVAYPSGVDSIPKVGAGVKLVRYDATPGPKEFERLNAAIVAAKLQVPIAAEYPLAAMSAVNIGPAQTLALHNRPVGLWSRPRSVTRGHQMSSSTSGRQRCGNRSRASAR